MPVFFVTGATGQQGGAVVKALQAHQADNKTEVEIRALTRNVESSAAKALANEGVKLIKGSLTDRAALQRGLTGADAAYLVTDFRGPDDVAGEIEQGKTFVDDAKEIGLPHLIFSSVAGADTATSVEHFQSKRVIEQYIHAAGLSYTIIRPTGFLEVIPLDQWPRYFMMGAMQAVFGDVPQKWIACEDIGKAVCAALAEPRKWKGKTVHVCGQVATVEETQKEISSTLGTSAGTMWLPKWFVLALTPKHCHQMFLWLTSGAQPGSVEETRTIVPEPLSIAEWARKQSKIGKGE